MSRFSDGRTYKDYCVSDDGMRIILPRLALKDYEVFARIAHTPMDPHAAMLTQWRSRVQEDLNIPELWENFIIIHNINGPAGGDTALVRKTEGYPVIEPTILRRVNRTVKVIRDFEDSNYPVTGESKGQQEIRINNQALLFVLMMDAAGHK